MDKTETKQGKVIRISRLPYLRCLLKRGIEAGNKLKVDEPMLKMPSELMEPDDSNQSPRSGEIFPFPQKYIIRSKTEI